MDLGAENEQGRSTHIYLLQLILTNGRGMRCLRVGAEQLGILRIRHHGAHVASRYVFLLVTCIKLIDFGNAVNINSEKQDA